MLLAGAQGTFGEYARLKGHTSNSADGEKPPSALVTEMSLAAVQGTFGEYARLEGHTSNSLAAEAFVRYGPNTFQVRRPLRPASPLTPGLFHSGHISKQPGRQGACLPRAQHLPDLHLMPPATYGVNRMLL